MLDQAADLCAEGPVITLRDLYRQVHEAVAEVTSKELTWRNFRQILDGYERDCGEIPGLDRDTEADLVVDLTRHPRGPEELKAAARQLGLSSYTDLLALSPGNDPYAMGKPAEQKQARWFADLAGRVRRGLEKIHVRGYHYRWFTRKGDGLDGRQYENDKEHWQEISKASKIARVLGLVDPESFIDRRNKMQLRIYSEPRAEGSPDVVFSVTGSPGEEWRLPPFSLDRSPEPLELPSVTVSGYEYSGADQPEVLAVATEKMEDILDPVCRELGIDLLPGTGYESYTRAIQLLRHAEARGQRLHVWYVSDYDNAGGNMPVSVSRHCQYFADQLGIKAEITLDPLALTAEQVERYDLPKAPDKNQTELEALEDSRLGELARILRAAVKTRRDATLEERLEEAAAEAQAAAEETWEQATAGLQADLDRIRADAARVIEQHADSEQAKAAEISKATAELRAQIKAIEDRIKERYATADTAAQEAIDAANARLEELTAQVRDTWDSADFGLPERPEPEVDTDDSSLLYDSRRHWLDQLRAFKVAKGGSGAGPDDEPNGDADGIGDAA